MKESGSEGLFEAANWQLVIPLAYWAQALEGKAFGHLENDQTRTRMISMIPYYTRTPVYASIFMSPNTNPYIGKYIIYTPRRA
jgi:hypothetical protein